MSMRIDIEALTDGSRGKLAQGGGFGDARETACLMSALTGATSFKECEAAGWPIWLAQLGAVIFDAAPSHLMLKRGNDFAEAVRRADAAGVDWGVVFRRYRLDYVLPTAMDACGTGDEHWRVDCRAVVQWSIDHGGEAAGAARAARAAYAARAADAAYPAYPAHAAGAAYAAYAAGAADAAYAAGAANASRAAAHTQLFDGFLSTLDEVVAAA